MKLLGCPNLVSRMSPTKLFPKLARFVRSKTWKIACRFARSLILKVLVTRASNWKNGWPRRLSKGANVHWPARRQFLYLTAFDTWEIVLFANVTGKVPAGSPNAVSV